MTYGFTLANQWFYYIFARYNLQITHMKKSIVLLIVSLLSLSLEAQERLSYTLEIVAAAGIGRGPLASLTPQFAVQYDLGAGFIIGAGAGARFAAPCLQYINKNGTMTRQFCEELDIPVFLRLGYGMEQYFATLDAGYALGVFSFYGASGGSGKGPGACYSGLFFEPQVGRSVGRRGALSLGVLMQRSIVEDVVIKESGTTGTPSSSVSSTHNTRKLMTPAITLRYGFLF